MAVTLPREKWTDERLDDLNKKVDKGFAETKDAIAETKAEIKGLRQETKAEIAKTQTEMREGFARVDREFKDVRREMKEGFEKASESTNARFDALNRTLIVVGGTIIAALIGTHVF